MLFFHTCIVVPRPPHSLCHNSSIQIHANSWFLILYTHLAGVVLVLWVIIMLVEFSGHTALKLVGRLGICDDGPLMFLCKSLLKRCRECNFLQ
jgi:hypothetical protein